MMRLIFVMLLTAGSAHCYSILTPPSDATGILRGTAEFKCEVDVVNIPVMAWKCGNDIVYSLQYGKEDYPKGNVKYSVIRNGRNFTLEIHDLEYIDGGTYSCGVVRQAEEAHLIVIDTPQLTTTTSIPVEGSTAEYICTAQFAGPKKEDISPEHYPQLQMFLDGKLLNGTVKEQEQDCINKCYNLTQIQNMTLEISMHGKPFTCEITTFSTAIQVNTTSKITVLYSVRDVDYEPRNASYLTGTIISCMADGSPEPQFVWDNQKTGNESHGQFLQITEKMIGQNVWRCTANNSINGRTYQESVSAVFDVFAEDLPLSSENGSDPENGQGETEQKFTRYLLLVEKIAALKSKKDLEELQRLLPETDQELPMGKPLPLNPLIQRSEDVMEYDQYYAVMQAMVNLNMRNKAELQEDPLLSLVEQIEKVPCMTQNHENLIKLLKS